MFNLIFTAFPIGVYASLDFQHTKQDFMTKPLLYSIGLTNQCFNTALFQSEMMQAVFNALILMTVAFYTVGDFWSAACLVYAEVVIVATLRVAQKLNAHTWISTVILLVSASLYFIQFYIEAQIAGISNANIYKIFGMFISSPLTYLILFYAGWSNFAQFMIFGSVTSYNRSAGK